jgi:hypothetical protein
MTVSSAAKAPVAPKNIPLAEPEGIVSEDGTVKLLEFELKTTVPPPDPLRVTVHALAESGPTVAGLHAIALISELVCGTTRESVAVWDEPFSVAVTLTLWSAMKAFDVAENTPLAEPDEIVSEDGTVKLVEFELSPMVPPPDPVSVTVQVLEESGLTVVGLQAMEAIPVLASGAASESVADLVEPFNVPVTVTV